MPMRADSPNHLWSYDFLHDETRDGRRLKCLTLLDEYTREGLAIHCARSITAGEVGRVLEELFSQRRAPACLKSDNGPELMAKRVTAWLKECRVKTHFIDPGSPWQNGLTRVSTVSSEMVVSIAGRSILLPKLDV
jgi:putative transposase